jgi:predicted flap endonuclease-1-like 5' DNA nuclease
MTDVAPPPEDRDRARGRRRELTRIPGIGETIADRLARHGIHGYRDLAGCDPETLTRVLGTPAVSLRLVRDWIREADRRSR